jgi:NADH-quinone oxidoreductase subunit B
MPKDIRTPMQVITTTTSAIHEFLKMGCCGVEMIAAGCSHYDTDRFGIIPRCSPRHADVMVISGYIVRKYFPALKRLYEQMPSPKWVICMARYSRLMSTSPDARQDPKH